MKFFNRITNLLLGHAAGRGVAQGIFTICAVHTKMNTVIGLAIVGSFLLGIVAAAGDESHDEGC
ncbi:TPA: hypothetical protein ACGQ50_000786 [Enterobacter cloacae]